MLASYTGAVAAGRIPVVFHSTYKQMMSRTKHQARDNISSLQIAFGNWYVPISGVETATGASTTITASVEYPEGHIRQITFSGSASGTIASGTTLVSDAALIVIPDGAEFWVRSYITNTAGVVYCDSWDASYYGAAEYGASGIADKTLSGTLNPIGNYVFPPLAIIGSTRKPSVLIIGDSRAYGTTDTIDSTAHVGTVARSLGGEFGLINVTRSGDDAQSFTGSHALRVALADYVSHVVTQIPGVNDLTGGRTATQMKADAESIIGYFPGKEVFVCTVEPRVSNSTDNWATLGGQTVDAATNTARVTYNAYVRGGLAGAAGYFDIADALESSRDSGKWKVTGAPYGYTTDGTHEPVAGNKLVRDLRVIDPAVLHEDYRRFATPTDMALGVATNLLASPAGVREALKSLAGLPVTTFNLTVSGTTTAGTAGYSGSRVATMLRLGPLCIWHGRIAWTSHDGTGGMEFGGFPYANMSATDLVPQSAFFTSLTYSGQVMLAMNTNAKTARLYNQASGGGTTLVPLDSSATLYLGGFYFTNDPVVE